MTQKQDTGSLSTQSRETKPKQEEIPGIDRWLESLSAFLLNFDRFGWDILGLTALAITLLTLLGLANLSAGSILSAWVRMLKQWFGYGSFILLIFFSLFTLGIFRRAVQKKPGLKIGRIIALEGWLFASLAFLALFNKATFADAEQGQGGGIIGWGLAWLVNAALPSSLGTGLTLIAALVLFIIGFGLHSKIAALLDRWLLPSELDLLELDDEVDLDETYESDSFEEDELPEDDDLSSGLAPDYRDLNITVDQRSLRKRDETLPSMDILMTESETPIDRDDINETAHVIERTLGEFGIPCRVAGYQAGPSFTLYGVEPGLIEKTHPDGSITQQKVRVRQIANLRKDLARALSVRTLRIQAPVPGQPFVGIEVPNQDAAIVKLRSILESKRFQNLQSPLALALGRDVAGKPVVADLEQMPHLLIAGSTGSGKSICIQSIITCLVMNNEPDLLRLVLMDPKKVELMQFNGLPHVFGEVETEFDRMTGILRWATAEMDNRYKLLEAAVERNLTTYNRKMKRRNRPTLPYIIIVIDELADLMTEGAQSTEEGLIRLSQKARAVGIHLVVATQRPSTEIITGLIKANFPARVAFNVPSGIDSKVILDTPGAENLMGKGDMLFLNSNASAPIRAQGVLVNDQEIARVIDFWQRNIPIRSSHPETEIEEVPWEEYIITDDEDGSEDIINEAIQVIKETGSASASLLQRRLNIGYPKAARLLDQLSEMGIVSKSPGSGKERDILVPLDEEDESEEEGKNWWDELGG